MALVAVEEDVKELVDGLNFAEKVDRSLDLIRQAWEEFGDHYERVRAEPEIVEGWQWEDVEVGEDETRVTSRRRDGSLSGGRHELPRRARRRRCGRRRQRKLEPADAQDHAGRWRLGGLLQDPRR